MLAAFRYWLVTGDGQELRFSRKSVADAYCDRKAAEGHTMTCVFVDQGDLHPHAAGKPQ